MRRILTIITAAVLALPLLAADLGKYNNWNDSPQGWFMSEAEREQWTALTSEADAAQFVAAFLARRDAKFADEIALRVKKADQYLTVGKTPGSQTLRGKVVILLGPPSAMDVSAKKARAGGRSGSVAMSMGAAGEAPGVGLADVAEVGEREAMSGGATADKLYTLSYAAEQLPTKKSLTVVVEVNGESGKDSIRDKRARAELEKAFEAAAEASVKQ